MATMQNSIVETTKSLEQLQSRRSEIQTSLLVERKRAEQYQGTIRRAGRSNNPLEWISRGFQSKKSKSNENPTIEAEQEDKVQPPPELDDQDPVDEELETLYWNHVDSKTIDQLQDFQQIISNLSRVLGTADASVQAAS
jgi:hypothetical protein